MLIYIIEDDPLKAESLRNFLREADADAQVTVHRSYNSGLSAIRAQKPDLLVLDMTLPTYDRNPTRRAGRLRPLGGYELLRKVKLHGITVSAVVVTMLETFGEGEEEISYDDMTTRCETEFGDGFLGSIRFQLASSGWQSALNDIYQKFKALTP